MNRTIIYSQEQARSFDMLWGWKDSLFAFSDQWQAILGSTIGVWSGFTPFQTTPASLTINLTAGRITQVAQADPSPYGSIDLDTTLISQTGVSAASTITIANTLVSGSQWVLVQVQFSQVSVVRPNDPNNGVPPFYNPANPANPYQGAGNDGGILPTVRQGLAVVSLVYGTAGDPPPQPSANCLPMYLIELSAGQETITTSEILLANPTNGGSGYPYAPQLAGLLNSHHGGTPGQAPQINAGTELQGIVGWQQLPVTDTVNTNGKIPVLFMNGLPGFTFTGNPNGNIPGQLGDFYKDSSTGTWWTCTVSGVAGIAVWAEVNPILHISQNIVIMTSSGTYVPSSNMLYCTMEIFGAGGGGGNGGSGNFGQSGAGGGAAGFGTVTPTAFQVGTSATVTIGAGGPPNSGSGGSTTVVASGFTAIATGGISGEGVGTGAAGGSGGGFSLTGSGVQYIPCRGGGGGGGFDGSQIPYSSGGHSCGGAAGGSTSRGGGGAGTFSGNGQNGQLFGGGGGGAGGIAYGAGGYGGNGGVVITEFIVSE